MPRNPTSLRQRALRRPGVRWFLALSGSALVALLVQVSGGPPAIWLLPIVVMLAFIVRRRERFATGERRRAARNRSRGGPRSRP